jgi:hypothetical protein
MSVPAAKAFSPAPVMTMARNGPSGSIPSQISRSRAYISKVSALRACGRFSVMMPMPFSSCQMRSCVSLMGWR